MTAKQRDFLQMMLWVKRAIAKHGPIKGYVENLDVIQSAWAIEEYRKGRE